MSHLRVKTTFEQEGVYNTTDTVEIYCHHNNTVDITTFYYADGSIVDMSFQDYSSGRNKWDAIQKLMFPFKDEWFGELEDGVEYYTYPPWERLGLTDYEMRLYMKLKSYQNNKERYMSQWEHDKLKELYEKRYSGAGNPTDIKA